jgi:hypothetical protein
MKDGGDGGELWVKRGDMVWWILSGNLVEVYVMVVVGWTPRVYVFIPYKNISMQNKNTFMKL